VLLETEELVVRGPMRVRVPFGSIARADARNGVLTVHTADGVIALELGDDASGWLDKIRNPRSRLDKLGVKTGAAISIVGSAPPDFIRELEARGVAATRGRAAKGSDIIFLISDSPAALAKLATLTKAMDRDGAIWVVHPRGRKDFADTHVFAAAKAAGLVDVKVARFSDTQTAEKLVIPKAKR
jgi:hypothetical protein